MYILSRNMIHRHWHIMTSLKSTHCGLKPGKKRDLATCEKAKGLKSLCKKCRSILATDRLLNIKPSMLRDALFALDLEKNYYHIFVQKNVRGVSFGAINKECLPCIHEELVEFDAIIDKRLCPRCCMSYSLHWLDNQK